MTRENEDFYWSEVKRLLDAATNGQDTELGVAEMRKSWVANKSWLFPFFDEHGRKAEICTETSEKELRGEVKFATSVARESIFNYVWKHLGKINYSDCTESGQKYSTEWVLDEIYFLLTSLLAIRINGSALDYYPIFEFVDIRDNEIKTSLLERLRPGQRMPKKGQKVTSFVASLIKNKEIERLVPSDIMSSRIGIIDDLRRLNALSDELRNFMADTITTALGVVSETLKGGSTVVLSINPLDMLLASHGDITSCHNIVDGGYRSGVISYICDGVTAIAFAYRRSASIRIVSENSCVTPIKTWRQMVYFDKTRLSAIHSRQYTRNIPPFEKMARRFSARVLADFGQVPYEWYVSSSCSASCEDDDGECGSSKYRILSSYWAYRDDASSRIKMKQGGENPNVQIGAERIPCLICGGHRWHNSSDAGHFTCEDCGGDDITFCVNCNERIDGEIYWFHDDAWCEYCYEDNISQCYDCGEDVLTDDLCRVIRNGDTEYVCQDCFNDHYNLCHFCGENFHNNDLTFVDAENDYVCDDCMDNVEECECCGDEGFKENFTDYITPTTGEVHRLCVECGACDICGELVSSVRTNYVGRSYAVCDSCMNWIETLGHQTQPQSNTTTIVVPEIAEHTIREGVNVCPTLTTQ